MSKFGSGCGKLKLLLWLLLPGAFISACEPGTIQISCDGVDCSGKGTCRVQDSQVLCDCEAGFHAEGTTCVENKGCAGVDCSPNGSCVASGAQPSCQCQPGYHASGLSCVQDDPCTGVNCGPNGSCVASGSQPACQCQAGYHASGLSCVQDDPCTGVNCGPNGSCVASGGQPACQCQPGYQPQGLTCVVQTDPYDSYRQRCVDQINTYRATLSLAALNRWKSAESCVDGEAKKDSDSNTAHSAFGSCSEWAQNECPRWGSVEDTVTGCLAQMWAEGPGQPYSQHGHYINMTNPSYTRVACGFYEGSNGVWAAQDFQ